MVSIRLTCWQGARDGTRVAEAAAGRACLRALLVLLLLPMAQARAVEEACSRAQARHARHTLEELVLPLLDEKRYKPPATCPWLPARDMYLDHERHKEGHMGQWRCLYNDSKVFRGEQFLDQHMANRHAAQIPAGADVCLADWCDVLLCDLAAAPAAWRCPHDGLEQARHRCRQAIEHCAPASDPAAARLRGSLERHLCSHLTCAGTGQAL